MAVYCEKIEGQKIIEETGNAKKVLIVGCPSCTNISLSANNDLPFLKYSPAGITPVYTKMEIEKISSALKKRGINNEAWLPRNIDPLCCLHENFKNKLAGKYKDADCIIVMACEAGEDSIRGIFPGKKTVRTMAARGIITCTVKNGKINEVFIDKANMKIRKISLD